MWRHFIFIVTILLVSFKHLNADSLVLKSDSFSAKISSTKIRLEKSNLPLSIQQKIKDNKLQAVYPSLQSIAEIDAEMNQDWLMDRWLVTVDLLWHELLASMLKNNYGYEHTLDLEPIPIARFLLFEQIKIPF
ncbi:hypothetical protein HX021_00495 [Sphingobacterium sp. N143]|mgnify:CR=1 FL=1|uniref:hypothetical protein n=1 Tax=Sphingobacterium sp. N143 TaxID=2746727 RepID=UPI002577697A|nr:hypothetical protein [Sphingobacterium sp. N143]MDM1292772.1 hypothetical protein [Sphingobacterium sp. N143]